MLMRPVLSLPSLQKNAVGSPFWTASKITCEALPRLTFTLCHHMPGNSRGSLLMATASYICTFCGSHTWRVHAISPLNASKTVMYMPTRPSLLDSLHINRPVDACIKSSACTETLTACPQKPEGHDSGSV